MGFLKEAMTKTSGWRRALQYGGTAAGAVGFSDVMTHGRNKSWDEYKEGLKDPSVGRIGNTLLNAAIGTLAANRFRAGGSSGFGQGMTALLGIPGKDVLFGLNAPVEGLPEFMSDTQSAARLGSAAAVAALPLVYYGGKKILAQQKDIMDQARERGQYAGANEGTIKVSLPPSRAGFPHTIVELPIGEINMSKSIVSKLGRDVRRKLREGTEARTYDRDPKTKDLIVAEPYLRDLKNVTPSS